MPARLPFQSLDRQCRPTGRLNRQARLGPSQNGPHRLRARPTTERQIKEPLLTHGRCPVVVERDFNTPRTHRSAQPVRDRRCAGRNPQALRASRLHRRIRLRLAGDRPARRVERLETILEDDRLSRPLDDGPDACPSNREPAVARTSLDRHLTRVDRNHLTRKPLTKAQLDPEPAASPHSGQAPHPQTRSSFPDQASSARSIPRAGTGTQSSNWNRRSAVPSTERCRPRPGVTSPGGPEDDGPCARAAKLVSVAEPRRIPGQEGEVSS